MNFRNANDEYGLISKLLHWLLAVAMIGLIAIGWYMTRLSDEDILYWRLLDFHEAMGLGVLLLVGMKAAWLTISPKPRQLAGLAPWERHAARTVHAAFIIATVVIPLTGLLFVATNGESINLYDLITIPNMGHLPKGVRTGLINVHYYLSYGCAMLIMLHIAAALKHHFIDLNNSLRRITF
jgi:cytochrome b561